MRSAPKSPARGFIGTLRARVFLGPMAGPTPPRVKKPRRPKRPRPTPKVVPDSLCGRVCVALGVLTEAFPDARDFALGDLVLAAWRLWPESFGLPGHKAVAPCSSSVLSKLSRDDSPVARGLIVRTARGRVALTVAGRRWYATHGAPTLPAVVPAPVPASEAL